MAEELTIDKTSNNGVEKYWLIWANAFIVFVGWLADITIPTLFLLSIESMVLFALSKDTKFVLSPLWMFLFVFTPSSIDISQNWYWFLMLLAPILGVIIHIIRFRPKMFSKENVLKGFTIALLFCVVSTSFGGITIHRDNWIPPVVICVLMILFALGYLFFSATTQNSKTTSEYIAMIMFTVGILLIAQTIVVFIRVGDGDALIEEIATKALYYVFYHL